MIHIQDSTPLTNSDVLEDHKLKKLKRYECNLGFTKNFTNP